MAQQMTWTPETPWEAETAAQALPARCYEKQEGIYVFLGKWSDFLLMSWGYSVDTSHKMNINLHWGPDWKPYLTSRTAGMKGEEKSEPKPAHKTY